MEIILEFIAVYWKPVFEIALLAAFIYYMFLLFRGTRGAAVLTGFIIVLLVIVGLTHVFQLDVISWILGRFFTFLAIAVLVIFQPELRRALAEPILLAATCGAQQGWNPHEGGLLKYRVMIRFGEE